MILTLPLLAAVLNTASCDPVIVLENAVIHTVAEASPRVDRMAFDRCGEILATGDAVDELKDRQLKLVDLKGRTVVPGFIDAHGHLMGLGFQQLQPNLMGTGSKADIVSVLKAFETQLPEEAWLVGRGWDQNDWPEKAFPTRQDLDQAFPERPVWLERIDGHAGWANSAALAQADRDFSGSWQPEGGRIVRDEEGQPTGVLVDTAMQFVEGAIPSPSADETELALDRALTKAASVGLTGVHDAGTSLATWARYEKKHREGGLTLRVYAMADGDREMLARLCRSGHIQHDNWLWARSVKFYADGALGSRGAALLADYHDDPGNRGLLIQPPEALRAQVTGAAGCGLQVNIHAIGDRGNRVVLDAYARAAASHPDNPGRHRIEHVQVVALSDLERIAEQGLVASMQPTHATSDMYWAEDRVGPQRIRGAYAWATLEKLGVPLALGSDFPVEKPDPLLGFYASITRRDESGWPEGGWRAEEALNRQRALYGFTLGAAYAGFAERVIGSLEAGKRADLVVLSADIMEIPEEQILKTRVLATVVDGRVVFRHADAGELW
ncbi:MAG: amidohydrolase [Xanthomonadales bacterium]|nr:amidohydrolase [Xanthomonadales bacterium]